MREFNVLFVWDSGVWCANSHELGLTLEHGSFDALVERVRMAVPEMAELNFGYTGDIKLSFDIERSDELKVVTA